MSNEFCLGNLNSRYHYEILELTNHLVRSW